MSVEAMAIALNHSRARGAAKLVLLGIANHDGDGGSWPSVATLARYAGVTPRNVQKHLDTLVELREITRQVNAGGTAQTSNYTRPNLYHFLLSCPPTCDRSTRHRSTVRPVEIELPDPLSDATGGVASDREGVSPATPEPSYNQPPLPQLPNARTDARAEVEAAPCRGSRTGVHDFSEGRWCANACGAVRDPEGQHA